MLPEYGAVSLTRGMPVMTPMEGANAAISYIMPLKIRKSQTKKQADSFIAGDSTFAATPVNPQ